jgi:hypothetical protein
MTQRKTFFHRIRTLHPRAVTISILAFLGVLGKFAYIFFLKERDIDIDFFGYSKMSRFLWAFGNQVFDVAVGLLFWISSNFHPRKSYSKKLFRWVSVLFSSIGFYFMFWIFLDTEYFNDTVEVAGAVVFAIFATGVFTLLLVFLTREITNLQELKNSFFDFIIEFRLHYKKLLINALHRNEEYKATYNEILDDDLLDDAYDEMLKKETEKTENSMKNVVQEIDDWNN